MYRNGRTLEETNRRELERLQEIYPLFRLEFSGNDFTHGLAHISESGHIQHFGIENGHLSNVSLPLLDHAHMQKSLSTQLMNQYPDLFISVMCSHTGCTANVWINRPNEKGEADDDEFIGNKSITSDELHKWLSDYQIEAVIAKKDGWFFCSGHKQAEPKEEYGYFYFAGKFCKLYGEENPEHLKKAQREDYR